MVPLNEVYFGKTTIQPFLDQANIVFDKIRNKEHVTAASSLDSDVLKLNRLIEKTFGYRGCSIYFIPDNTPNACTFPISIFYSKDELRKIFNSAMSNPQGFRYKDVTPGISFIMELNIGLFSAGLTNDEIVAVMLHEIGHSFFVAITNNQLMYVGRLPYLLRVLVSTANMIKDKIKNKFNLTRDTINKEFNQISNSINKFKDTIIQKHKKFTFFEDMSANMIKSRYDYTNEKFADTFATMYGFGPELHSAMLKMNKSWYIDKNKPVNPQSRILEKLQILDMRFNDFLNYIFDSQDEHPNDITRTKISIEYIRKELAKEGIDPKIKRELLSQISLMEDVIQEYIDMPNSGYDQQRIYHLYMNELYERFGGDRREQDTDNDALFDTIDKRYDELKD